MCKHVTMDVGAYGNEGLFISQGHLSWWLSSY